MSYKNSTTGYFRFLIIAILIAIPILGVVFDLGISLKQMPILVKIEDLREFSLVLIQIQATIVTLTLSVISILSGFLSDFYMGISISYYFLEINPRPLTHKKIISAEFLLLGVSLIAYTFSLYNFVAFIFITSSITIVLSIGEMYEVFKGKKYAEDAIKKHMTDIFEKAQNIEKIENYAREYIKNWKAIAASQSTEEFKEYYDVFFKLIFTLLERQKIDKINSYTEEVAVNLLHHDSQDCKLRGLLFVNDVYKKTREWIEKKVKEEKKEKEKEEKKEYINQPIDLIDKVYASWYSALYSLDAEIVKQKFIDSFGQDVCDLYVNKLEENPQDQFYHWYDFFTRNIFYVKIFMHGGSFVEESTIYLTRQIGNYIEKQSKKAYFFDFPYWQKLINDGLRIEPENLSYKMKIKTEGYCTGLQEEEYNRMVAERDIHLSIGYIMNNQTELVVNGWFTNKKPSDGTSWHILRKCMSVHFFMYYMIKNRINEAEIEQIDGVITEKKFIKSLINFYYEHTCIGLENKLLLDIQMEKELEKIPKRFPELYPTVEDGDKKIVWSYFLYVVVTIDMKKYHSKSILADLTQTDDFKNINKKLNLKKDFTYLHKYLSENELSDSEAQDLTNRMIAYLDAAKKSKEK